MNGPHARAALVSLGGALLVLGLKAAAYFLTGSVSLLSDAAESIVNVLAAAVLLFATRVARRPADYEHPYGHQKAELLSSAFEALLIVAAGAMLLLTGVQRLLNAQELQNVGIGVSTALAAGLVNLGLALWLRRQARTLGSPGLAANARHLLTDVWSSVGVIVAVLLVHWSGWLVLDPIVAMVVALNILREGWQLMSSTLSQLLDERLPEAEEALVLRELDATSGLLGYHRLRSRLSGDARFIEVDVFLDPQTTVEAAHTLVRELEDRLAARLPNMISTIHVEPFAKGVREGASRPKDEF